MTHRHHTTAEQRKADRDRMNGVAQRVIDQIYRVN